VRVVFHPAALEDIDCIFAWIAKDDPGAAASMIERIRDRISFLEIDALTHMGRPGLVPGTRELIEYPYIIVYRLDAERREIVVIAVMHGAQDRPSDA
jgi:toxin ParE1/3/4